jgi:ribosome maturation factor RimP
MREADLDKITEMAQRVAVSEGLTLVDVELKEGRGSRLLRVYIDKPEGISHADCELVSEQLSAMLDVEDPFPGSYTLEVSSPGLDRKLVKASDFAHFAGRKARVVVREPVDDQKVLEGRLAGFEAGRVRLDLGEAGLKELELANIQKARLVVEIRSGWRVGTREVAQGRQSLAACSQPHVPSRREKTGDDKSLVPNH